MTPQLFKNNGGTPPTFTEVGSAAGVESVGSSSWGAAWADFDGDGHIDLYVAQAGNSNTGATPNTLFKNKGDGTFEDVTIAAGVGDNGQSWSVVSFVGGHRLPCHSLPRRAAPRHATTRRAESHHPMTCHVESQSWADYNGDGFPDIYTANGPSSSSSISTEVLANKLYVL